MQMRACLQQLTSTPKMTMFDSNKLQQKFKQWLKLKGTDNKECQSII